MRSGGRVDEEAVSEIVGTLLLVAISIVLFSGLSVVVWDQMQTSPLPANADLRLDSEGDWLTLTHVWGESLPVEETRLLLTMGATRLDHRLDEAPLAGHLTHRDGTEARWDVGETLWLACPEGEDCVFPGGDVDTVTAIDNRANAVVFSNQPGVTPGLILNELPDLVVEVEPLGCDQLFRAKISNFGIKETLSTSTIVAELFINGNYFESKSRDGSLAVHDSYIVVFDTVASGSGLFQVSVDKDDAIPEIAGDPPGENIDEGPFTAAADVYDPGFAYRDADDNGLFNACLGDVPADLADGEETTPAGTGLVIPPSVDLSSVSVATDRPIVFTSGASLTIGTDLSATGANGITLSANQGVMILGGPTFTSTGLVDVDAGEDIQADALTIDAAGQTVRIDSTGGDFNADGLRVNADGGQAWRLEVNVFGHISMQNANVRAENRILLDAKNVDDSVPPKSLNIAAAFLEANPGAAPLIAKAIQLNGDGDVAVQGATIRTNGAIGIDVGDSSNTVFVGEVRLEKMDLTVNTAELRPLLPTCPPISGDEAHGEVKCL